MKVTRKAILAVCESVLLEDLRKATLFVNDNFTVKATRQYKPNSRAKSTTLVVTFGKPNYKERKIIKKCRKNGRPLPKYVEFQYYRGPVC